MPKANLSFLLASVAATAGWSAPPGPGVAGGAASRPHTSIDAWTDPRPQPRDKAAMRRTMLVAHATARALVGVPPLAWSEELARSADQHARDLAARGRMEHHGRFAAAPGIGENLWMGTRGGYSYAEMVAAWLGEAQDYVNAPAPGFSRTGAWQDVGHYSQMVWRDTTSFGCAVVPGQADEVLVCRYAPAGNVLGRAAF